MKAAGRLHDDAAVTVSRAVPVKRRGETGRKVNSSPSPWDRVWALRCDE